jgi:chromosome segregation ATPase
MRGGMMATVPLELYELFEEKLGKEEAKEAIALVEKAFGTIEEKAKEQKTVIKAELREELRKELATKEDVLLVKEELFGEMGKLEQKIETVRQEIETVRQEIETVRQEIEVVRQELKGDIKELKGEIKVLKILIYVTILAVVFMNKGTIEYLVNLIKMLK